MAYGPTPAPVTMPLDELTKLMTAKLHRFQAQAKLATPAGGVRLTTQQVDARMVSQEFQQDCVLVYDVDGDVPLGGCVAVCLTGTGKVRLRIYFRQAEDDWYAFDYRLVTRPHRGTKQQRERGVMGNALRRRMSWKLRHRSGGNRK
jgi:hypothetical protein